ncbi:hypothetical protein EC973_006164 [Apophysomyces ossiformis]|uniref:Uncharacterized protein n=1 Tax=Apophysomyces ossiformis TaxID=679940 RepID=A0A8H7BDF3_9FUNG|nr:hypothetical protein EC973_006164 [Apophysomyces ossiformis]
MRFNFFAISAAACLFAVAQTAPTGDIAGQVAPQTQQIETQAFNTVKQAEAAKPGANVDSGLGKKVGANVYKRGSTATVNNLKVDNVHNAVPNALGGKTAQIQSTSPDLANINTQREIDGVKNDVSSVQTAAASAERPLSRRGIPGAAAATTAASNVINGAPTGQATDGTLAVVQDVDRSLKLNQPVSKAQ